jgi:hypothetical protein
VYQLLFAWPFLTSCLLKKSRALQAKVEFMEQTEQRATAVYRQ